MLPTTNVAAHILQMFTSAQADAAAALVEAAANDGWHDALNLVERAFDVRGAILMGYENFSRHPVAVISSSAGMRPDKQADYLENFADIDVRAAFMARQPHGKIMFDHQMGPIGEIDQTPFYAEFLLPLDIGRFVGVNLGVGGGDQPKSTTYFALAKDNDAGPPSEEQAAKVLALGKLARSAVRMAGVIGALRSRSERLQAAIDALDTGVVFLKPGCVVADCNDAARRMLMESDAIRYNHGRLSFADSEADAKLMQVMRGDRALHASDMWIAKRDSNGGALVIIAANLDLANVEFGAPVLTLFLIDPQRQTRGGRQAWIRLFKLTPSESEVAELILRGMSRREIAELRGVSEGTVHTQMRALYAKLHVTKLNDAMLLLSATSGA
jgi:DNA-binding NarL/FixJ family response regulator